MKQLIPFEFKSPQAAERSPRILLFDVRGAAGALCVSVRFVRQLIARGKLPSVRLGKRVLVRARDLDELVERGGLDAKT